MSSLDTAINRIRAYARKQGWKKSRLAKEAGMSDTVLRDFDKPDWNPTADTIRRLEAIIPREAAAS
jgi:3,4-dihydroxy 2-butanone 4-phosphate synthase / GTP cyclohydrolase II